MSSPRSEASFERASAIDDILTTISKAEGINAARLTPPLHDVIDTDALEKLVQRSNEAVYVTFRYRQWLVAVQGGDEIEVTIVSDDE